MPLQQNINAYFFGKTPRIFQNHVMNHFRKYRQMWTLLMFQNITHPVSLLKPGENVSRRSGNLPLQCPNCSEQMKIVSFITDPLAIKKILKHLGAWQQKPSRDPPNSPENGPAELGFEPFVDDWSAYQGPSFQIN